MPPWRQGRSGLDNSAPPQCTRVAADEADDAADDAEPGAYVDFTLLDEASEEGGDAASAQDVLGEAAETTEDTEDWSAPDGLPQEAVVEEVLEFEHADEDVEDDALEDDVVQAMLLEDAAQSEDTTVDAAPLARQSAVVEVAGTGLGQSPEEFQSEDDTFLDTIYEG